MRIIRAARRIGWARATSFQNTAFCAAASEGLLGSIRTIRDYCMGPPLVPLVPEKG